MKGLNCEGEMCKHGPGNKKKKKKGRCHGNNKVVWVHYRLAWLEKPSLCQAPRHPFAMITFQPVCSVLIFKLNRHGGVAPCIVASQRGVLDGFCCLITANKTMRARVHALPLRAD